jgi:hypothetical protein
MSTHEIRALLRRHIAGEMTRDELIAIIAERRQISQPDAAQLLGSVANVYGE